MNRNLLVLLSCCLSTSALAQEGTLNQFQHGTLTDDFQLRRPTDLGHLRFSARVAFDYSNDELVFENELGDRETEDRSVVEHQFNADVAASLGLFDRLTVFVGLPIVLALKGDDLDPVGLGGLEPDGGGVGDLYVGARVRIFGDTADTLRIGAQLALTLPTAGSGNRYRGDHSVSVHPQALLEAQLGSLRVVANLGARLRPEQEGATNLVFGNSLTFGFGLAAPIFTSASNSETHLDVHAQLYGSSRFGDMFKREATPLEALAGLKLYHASGVVVGLAGGAGITRGFGSPDGRVVALVGYVAPADEGAPTDQDGDGIMDADDQCPAEPEDSDGFEDTDGCPDPDNDADGILDDADECPLEAETMNEFNDTDGCPDEVGDTDGDGIVDTDDRCPEEPEDVDQYEDTDGCPDPDNDGDGVLDAEDQCPLVAGTAATAGCPDRDADTVVDRLDNCPDEAGSPEHHGCVAPQRVVIREGRLEILDKVFFRTNRDVIQRRSYGLLENVVTVLNNHPELRRVRIEGHTDARGDHDYNVALSQRRADAVRTHLTEHGVDGARLEAVGFGPDRPIVADATTPEQHAENRRVEFNIVDDHEHTEHAEHAEPEVE